MYAIPILLLSRLHHYALDARRKNRTTRYFLWSAVAALSATIVLTVAALFVYVLCYAGLWFLALAVIAVLAVPLAGPLAIRHVLVPRGAFRLAYYLGWASRPGRDPTAYGLVVAAWAVAVRPSGRGEAWVASQRDRRIPLGDAEVIATALLAAARGDAMTARSLARSSLLLVENHPSVRELAGEWLAVDAAERGAWSELADDASAARWPASPLTFFLEGVAARRVGAPNAPSERELWARWLVAPKRAATRELRDTATPPPAPAPRVRDADDEAADDGVDAEATGAVALDERAPLPRAIAAHLAFGTGVRTEETLRATVRAWDAALTDGATHAWLARRAIELEAPLGAVDRALREVSAVVSDELGRLADAEELGAPASHGPVGDSLGRRLRHGRLDALEAGFTRWAARRHDAEIRSAIDEWREFIALRDAYTAAVTAGGLELRRLAFPHAYATGTAMAAWLWNARDEYALAHAIFRWLLDEALVVGDSEAIELGTRNCRLAVPTRSD